MPATLVVQTSFLGDVVLTTPLLAALARRGAVDVVVTPAAAALLEGHPAVRDVLVYDKRGAGAGARGFARLAARLRERRYAAAYHAQGSLRSAALSLAA
jgi:heptosyltransferase II